MSSTSTIPVAYRELQRVLSAVDWPARLGQSDAAVDVEIASELRDEGREIVLIGQVRGDQEFTALGAKHRDEDYTISLFVVVRYPGDSGLAALERAWQLWAVVESLLSSADYIALGQSQGVLWNELVNPIGTPTHEPEGSGYVVTSGVRFRSRIRPRS